MKNNYYEEIPFEIEINEQEKKTCQGRILMNDKEKFGLLYEVINDIFWMAIRYAHGRRTYAPYMVRSAYKKIKQVFPEFKLKYDPTIIPPPEKLTIGELPDDYLNDLFENEGENIL